MTNKSFMATLLSQYNYWDVYFELVCDLFRFAREYLTEEGLNEHPPCQLFYKGILRTVIILIHDFPDFLSAFSLQLALAIPDKYVQIKNIVLSAYPRELKFRSPKAIGNRDELEKESKQAPFPKYFRLKFESKDYKEYISMFQNNDKSLRSKLDCTLVDTQPSPTRNCKCSCSTSPGSRSAGCRPPTVASCSWYFTPSLRIS